jgi:hypothetical protein
MKRGYHVNQMGLTHLGDARYTEGLPATTTYCPRCSQLLIRRGETLYCLYGCTREWPIRGGSIARQSEYERAIRSRPVFDDDASPKFQRQRTRREAPRR